MHALGSIGADGPTEDEMREALQKLEPLWDELFPAEKEWIVKLLVDAVVVDKDHLGIHLRLHGLNSLVAELAGEGPAEVGKDGQTVDVHVPMEFKVRGGRKEIILPADAAVQSKAQPNRPLVLALARAHHWQRMLDTGQVGALNDLAQLCKVDRSYVGRVVKLTSLGPDFVDGVLTGSERAGLSLAMLREDIPLLWDKQRQALDSFYSLHHI